MLMQVSLFVMRNSLSCLQENGVYPDVHPLIPGVLREKRHEHCRLMGDPRYVEKEFLWKHQHYSQCGLIPGRDVLFTFDYTGGELDYPLLREQILNWIEFCRNE